MKSTTCFPFGRRTPWFGATWALALTLVAFAGCSKAPPPGEPIPYSQLVAPLSDMKFLARLDAPAARLTSSFDRKGGNDDYNNPLSVDGDGWSTLADLKGPGVLTRFWFTGAESGAHPLRFYFDGEKKPRFETTIGAFCGEQHPFVSPLAAYEPFCWYSMVPLAFQERLVVKTPAGGFKPGGWPRIFYQIGHLELPATSRVESMTGAFQPGEITVLDATADQLREHASGEDESAWTTQSFSGVAEPGSRWSSGPIAGPGMIREIRVTPDFSVFSSFRDRNAMLRGAVFRIFWDDATEPSVETPLGDLFGSMWERRRYASRYFGMTNQTFFIRFPMPFQANARIEIENPATIALPIQMDVRIEPHAPGDGDWGYFHAAWRKSTPNEVGKPHVFVHATGRGRYVGTLLSTLSMDKSWWMLEGDEYFRVDGESFPRWHGTGLEDYFNGGWYYGSALVRPYHGLPFKAHYRTIQYRIHQHDPVAFEKSIAAELERGPDNASHGFMESVAFYYLDKPAPAGSDLRDPGYRMPPQDMLQEATVMTELNDMERLGDEQAADDYISAWLEARPEFPYADVLRVRQLAYRARAQGIDAVRSSLEQMAAQSPNEAARTQAADLLWFHEAPDRALLGVYANTPARVFLNGETIGTAGDAQRMQVYRVTIAPGPQALSIRARHREYPYWVQAALQTHHGQFYTSRDWKFSYPSGEDWAKVAYDDREWTLVGGAELGKGPPEEPYIWLEPNAFAGMMGRGKGIWVGGEWTDKSKMAVFRTTFTIPAFEAAQ